MAAKLRQAAGAGPLGSGWNGHQCRRVSALVKPVWLRVITSPPTLARSVAVRRRKERPFQRK
jgi:hypothetical protein